MYTINPLCTAAANNDPELRLTTGQSYVTLLTNRYLDFYSGRIEIVDVSQRTKKKKEIYFK